MTLPGRSLGISDYSEGCAAQGTRVYKVRGSTPSPSWDMGRRSTAHSWPCHMGGPNGKKQTEGTGQKRSYAHSDTPHSSAQSSYGKREKFPHLTGYPSCREDLCLGTQDAGLLHQQQLGPQHKPRVRADNAWSQCLSPKALCETSGEIVPLNQCHMMEA